VACTGYENVPDVRRVRAIRTSYVCACAGLSVWVYG